MEEKSTHFKNPNPDKQKSNRIESNMLYERALGIAAAGPKARLRQKCLRHHIWYLVLIARPETELTNKSEPEQKIAIDYARIIMMDPQTTAL